MAALAHISVGLAAKGIEKKIPVIVLILSAIAIDLIWAVLYFSGIEYSASSAPAQSNPWSHGLFMSLIWSFLAALIAWLITKRNKRMAVIIGLLVFSHWVIDFITHPMLAAYPNDKGIPLFFYGSPEVGLGLYSSLPAIFVCEYGGLLIGLAIYITVFIQMRRQKKQAVSHNL